MDEHHIWESLSPHRDSDGQILHFGDPRAELDALRAHRGFRNGGGKRVLEIAGADRVELLQRISAGDFGSPKEGGIYRIPFTDAKGRLVDIPWISVRDESLLVICGFGRREQIQSWIEAYTILEDVVCEPHDSWILVESVVDAPPMIFSDDRAEEEIEGLMDEGWRAVGELAHAQWCAEELKLRAGHDLDERFNPLEAGLRDWISFDKGCFIGQEVVARLENYEKVRRRPALLHGEVPLAVDSSLTHQNRRGAQVVHSAARLDAEGAYALVLLEREIQEGAALRSEDGAQWSVEKAAAL